MNFLIRFKNWLLAVLRIRKTIDAVTSAPEQAIDEEERRRSVMPEFAFDFGTAQTGIVKRGLTLQMDCSMIFVEAELGGYRIDLLESEINSVTLRRGVDYKFLVIRFVNVGCGEAQNCSVKVMYADTEKQFSAARYYLPDEECEYGLVVPRDIVLVSPLQFHLSYWDIYDTHYFQDFALNLDTDALAGNDDRQISGKDVLALPM